MFRRFTGDRSEWKKVSDAEPYDESVGSFGIWQHIPSGKYLHIVDHVLSDLPIVEGRDGDGGWSKVIEDKLYGTNYCSGHYRQFIADSPEEAVEARVAAKVREKMGIRD